MRPLSPRRVLTLTGKALPNFYDIPLLEVSRLHGKEKLSALYDYTIEVATLEHRNLSVKRCGKSLI